MKCYPLTTPQRNIWNLQKYYGETAVSNLCGAVFYKEKRDSQRLQKAVSLFIQSQSGIRLRFREEGEPMQYVSEEMTAALDIPVMEFSEKEEFECYAENFVKEPMELTEGAMYRFVIFQLKNQSGILAVLSHLVADAWTFGLMAKQVEEAYKLAEGNNISLQQMDYREFVRAEEDYFASERFQKDKTFWTEKYSGAASFEKTLIKPSVVSPKSIAAERITKALPVSLEQRLRKFGKEHSLTLAVLFETAIMIYLARINAENHTVTLGVPVLNRNSVREKKTAGMFVSTMPLTVKVHKKMSALEMAEQITKGHIELFRHQKYPYTDILKGLRGISQTAGQFDRQNVERFDGNAFGNLYDVMISYQNARTDVRADTKWYFNGYIEIPLVIHIDNRDDNECHTFHVDYQTEVFRRDEAALLIKRFEYILEQIIEDGNKKIGNISIIPKKEFKKITEEFNDTAVDYPKDRCVHELFEEQAVGTPERIALVFRKRKFSYRRLDEMSNALAHFLRERGIGNGDVVPIMAKRSWHIVAAMLGILKAGAAYMPVSPDYPSDRVITIMETACCRIAFLYDCGEKEELQKRGIECVELATFNYEGNISPLVNGSTPRDLCYVVFTSGSTGIPKGVSVCHYNVVNYCNCNKNNNVCYQLIRKGYRSIVSVTNIVFDIFVTETLFSLLNGITVYFADDEEAMHQDGFADLIDRNKIEIMQTTPTRMRSYMLDKENLGYLRNFKAIILGGEAFPIDMQERLREYTNAQIFNMYGPAETTVYSTGAEIMEEGSEGDVTIGRPIANTQIYILDSGSKLLPVGVAGELCIAGDGVGAGYLKHPELAAEKFVINPFATKENGHGKMLYHTGDLARWRTDGKIEYLGRIDTQVKIRGLRIELGEIEGVMEKFPEIALCAATDKKDENGRQYLVGYYTTNAGEGQERNGINEKALREFLSAKLPKYMVPNYFVRLAAMPMTPSGKTDRKSLPVPDFTMRDKEYAAPETEKEKILCHLLEELLGIGKMSVEEDFFACGGDSLMAIEYMAKAHDKGLRISVQNIFDYPTVRSLCRYLDVGKNSMVHYHPTEFEKYRKLFAGNIVDEEFVPRKRKLGNVFLTGATGFLGAHVLDQLMHAGTDKEAEERKIYCLIRGGKENECSRRLRETLHYYFGSRYEKEIGHRIIPVAGDIEDVKLYEKLLSGRKNDALPKNVQTIIHTAASVKHYGSYEYFYRVNCEGTKNVAAYAKAVGARMIHISTLSVSGNGLADDFSVYRSDEEKQFCETSFYISQPLDNVYIRSKFEAERAVYDAMLEGLDAKIIRVGNLTNRQSDFKFQPNYKENAFLSREKALIEFGLFPEYLLPLYAEFSPVDKTAEGIAKIAQYADRQSVFHLYSNHPVYFERFLKILHQLGIPMKVVDGTQFYEALRQTLADRETRYIYEAFQNDLDEQGRLVYDSNIRIESDFTVWFLRKVGFSWEETDLEYLKGYIGYFREIGYFA